MRVKIKRLIQGHTSKKVAHDTHNQVSLQARPLLFHNIKWLLGVTNPTESGILRFFSDFFFPR